MLDLDDKIDLNQQMNATLEAIARAIFTSWFVDFDPVHAKARGEVPAGMDAATAALFPDMFIESELGPIPAGWEIHPLDEIAHYQNGLAWKRYAADEDAEEYLSVIKIREMRMDGFDESSDRTVTDIKPSCKVYDGDMLFSWSGSLLVDIWT
ncbi:MAG: restriction endonuclease subunit S, partial [Anaerolineae bacterium]